MSDKNSERDVQGNWWDEVERNVLMRLKASKSVEIKGKRIDLLMPPAAQVYSWRQKTSEA